MISESHISLRTWISCLLIMISGIIATAQPAMEIYLFDYKLKKDDLILSNPRNISDNPGYDNQPSFLPNGSGILYSRTRGDQTDVALYTIKSGKTEFITNTSGSEYSPTPIPDKPYFSTIVLEKDGEQLLYQYPIEAGERSLVGPTLKIGYHCWFDVSTIYAFVLGDPFTLQECRIGEQVNTILADNPGRSLHKIPGTDKISFVSKQDSVKWIISTFHPETTDIDALFPTIPGAEDMTWLDEETILMGSGSSLYMRSLEDEDWKKVADLASFDLTGITRVAVHRKKGLLTVVVAE